MRAADLAAEMSREADIIASHLFPGGKREAREWKIGSLCGEEGKSLCICIEGQKAGVWSDFATGEAGDLLDLWMKARNIGLVEAMNQAKDFLGIKDDIQGYVRKNKKYQKPIKPKCHKLVETGKVFKYLLEKRKLSRETLELFKIADGGDCIVFPYMRNDEAVMIKTLKLEREKGKKVIKPTSKDQEPCLFGWQAITPNARSVIICEGEIDCMSLKQIGHDALSVPFGGGTGQNWIENEYDRINVFDTIYICMDQDEAGQNAAGELVDRLGRHRCRILTLNSYKDPNEALQNGFDIFDLQGCIDNAKTCDPEELKRLSAFHDEIMVEFYPKHEKQSGATLPWSKTKNQVRIRPGEITIWAGINSHGKSVLLSHVMADMASQGEKICIASMEMSPSDQGQKMYMQIGGVNCPSPEHANKIKKFIYDNIWLFNVYGTAKADKIIQVFEYARHRYGVTQFVIDSLAKCGFREDDYNAQKDFVDRLMEFAGKSKVHVHLVAHMRKGGDENHMPNKMDLKGTGALSDMIDNLFIVYRNKQKEKILKGSDDVKKEEYRDKPDTYLSVEKQRKTGEEPTFALWFHPGSCQFMERQNAELIKYIY